jgi:hemerythrin superfamily protein
MADDIVTMLTNDHRELKRLLDMMKDDVSSRPLALPVAVAMLEAHSEAEEERVYPALAREAGEKEEAEHAADEHHQAERMGKHLLEMDWESGEFDQALREWVDAVLHHVEEEETEMLPALGEALDSDRLEQLGLEFAERRSQALAGMPLNTSGHGGGTAPQAASEGMTRAELYDKARQLNIEGRSSMSKDELAREIRKAETGRKR